MSGIDTFIVASEGTEDVTAPSDGSVVGTVQMSSTVDVATAVDRATSSLDSWRHASPFDRSALLKAAAAALDSRKDEIAFLHSKESGKVLTQARREVAGAAFLLEENAHLGRFESGYLAPTGGLPGGETDMTIVERVPLGVVVCVIPFNFPVELLIEKAGAALAAGNTVIVKPPPQNPLATIETARVLVDAGLPDGVLSVMTGEREVSAALCAAAGVDAVSLTGSVGAGVGVAKSTAEMLRPLHLELGGNGAAVVMQDADLDLVVSETIRGRMLMNGQACAATKRLVVHESVNDEVVERLGQALSEVNVGEPTEESSDVGPLIDARSADRVAQQVSGAVAQGGKLVEGSIDARDSWFSPSLIASLPRDADVAKDEEIFGPVVSSIPSRTDEDAVEIVNSSQLALTAAIFSRDLEKAMGIAQRFQVGGVVINGTNNYRPPVVPFGGVGLAGTGREGIGYTFEEMTRTRFIAIKNLRPEGSRLGGSVDD